MILTAEQLFFTAKVINLWNEVLEKRSLLSKSPSDFLLQRHFLVETSSWFYNHFSFPMVLWPSIYNKANQVANGLFDPNFFDVHQHITPPLPSSSDMGNSKSERYTFYLKPTWKTHWSSVNCSPLSARDLNKEVWTLFLKANIINVWEVIINRKRLINSSDCRGFMRTGTLNIFHK